MGCVNPDGTLSESALKMLRYLAEPHTPEDASAALGQPLFKVRASLPERLLKLPESGGGKGSLEDAVKGKRDAFSGIVRDFIPYTVYDRYRLFPGAAFDGPAIIEERESTVIVGEDGSVKVDDYGFLWIDLHYEEE